MRSFTSTSQALRSITMLGPPLDYTDCAEFGFCDGLFAGLGVAVPLAKLAVMCDAIELVFARDFGAALT